MHAVSQNVSGTNLIKTEQEDMETMVVYHLHGKPIRFEIVLMQGRRKLFSIRGGGAESEGRRPKEIFRFSEMPFPGLWGRFDRILRQKTAF